MSDRFSRITANRHMIYPRYDPQNLVGREWLVEEVRDFRDDPNRRHLIIVGEPGGGKSSFLAYLAETWNCPLHFIRSDNIGAVASTDPKSFLISIGAQLHEKYGADIFDEGESVKTSVTAGLAQGQAEIIGRFIKELRTPLPFLTTNKRDVQVRVGAALGESRVVGEYIERLVDNSRTLDAVTLLHIAVLSPVKKIGELYPSEKVVILIDALDESLRHTGARILDVIPRVTDSDFPPNLRLVMTSRPGAHLDQAGFCDQDLLHLDDKQKGYWQANRQDTLAYVVKNINAPDIAAVIQSWPKDKTDSYIAKIVDSSDGNFLYLYFFFQELRKVLADGDQELERIGVPKDLDAIYRNFAVASIKSSVLGSIQFVADGEITEDLLAEWRAIDGVGQVNITGQTVSMTVEDSGRVLGQLYPLTMATGVKITGLQIKGTELGNWESKYVPILGILAVAYEPLNVDQVARFSRVELVYVYTIVIQLKQFLDEVTEEGTVSYRLYHGSFADYLLDNNRNRDFHLDGPAYHYQIAESYRGQNGSFADVDWPVVLDSYAFKHLVTHLAASNRFDDLHQLVATGNNQLTWAEAHYRISGSYFRCVQGLDLAWSRVPRGTWEGVGKFIRYALIRSSFNSLIGNIPTELVRELVRCEIWNPIVGLVNALQMPEEKDRADAIQKVAPLLSDQHRESAISFARNVSDDQTRARVLFALAPQLPGDLCLAAWEYGVDAFKGVLILDHKAVNERRNKFLHRVAPYYLRTIAPQLAPTEKNAFLAGLLKPVLEIRSQEDRDLVIKTLIGYLPDDLCAAAWTASLDLGDTTQRVALLGPLSQRLGRQALTETLSQVEQVEGERERALALRAIAPFLTEDTVDTALAILNTVFEPAEYAQTLGSLVRHMHEKLLQSPSWACAIQTFGLRDLVWMFGQMSDSPPEVQESVVRSAVDLLKETPRPSTLIRLLYERISSLPQNAHDRLIRTSLSAPQIVGDYAGHLGSILFGVGGNAANVIHKFLELRTRLPEILLRLPERDLRQGFAAEFGRIIANYEQLISELPPSLKTELIETANDLDLNDLLIALGAQGLTRHLPAQLQVRSIAPAESIQDPYWRSLVLANLVCLMEGPTQETVLTKAIESIGQITDPNHWRIMVGKFGAVLPARFAVPIVTDALRAMAAETDFNGVDRLVGCATSLPAGLRERVFAELLRINPEETPMSSAEIHLNQQLTLLIFREWLRAGNIEEIYAQLPDEKKNDFLENVFAVRDASEWIRILTQIDASLPERWQEDAIAKAKALTSPWQRVKALITIAQQVKEDLRKEALEAALSAAREVTHDDDFDPLMLSQGLLQFLSNPTANREGWPRAVALTRVAENLPIDERKDVLYEAVGLVRKVDDRTMIWQLWCRLADYLSVERLNELIGMLHERAAEDPYVWRTFFSLVNKVPDSVMADALPLIRQLSDKDLVITVLSKIARRLEGQKREDLVREAFAMTANLEDDKGWEQARAMKEIGYMLPPDLQKDALLFSRRIDEAPRAQYLRGLTRNLSPDLVDDAIAAGLEIGDPAQQYIALSRLTEFLSGRLKSNVLANLQEVESKDASVIALSEMGGVIPEEVDPFAVEEQWAKLQAAVNDPQKAPEIETEVLAGGSEWLKSYLFSDRPALISDLRKTAPVFTLGGPSLVDEIFVATRDVSRWYP